MDPATILVAVLTAGVFALLVWFEVNSRQNEARRKRELDLSHHSERDGDVKTQTETNKPKAA